ncbi:MAG: LacI family DNA-binding transcriptional regulator [Anaerolineaceae bacterium]|nr:MAG: LacI family transcriptional regulator [Candidatus Riflebacteria bacterium HGW-Riflebacteria-2]
MTPQVTLKTISKFTGFSVTQVSRALTGYSDVSEETREKILAAAKELGYYPNSTARQLQKQRTDTVGLILPTHGPRFSDPYFSELIAGIGDELTSYGIDLLISTQAPNPDEISAYRRMVEGKRVDGLIVVRTRNQDERIKYLLGTSLPFVAFGRSDLGVDFNYIDEDGEAGINQLTEYLINLGHRKIGFISAPLNLMFANYRLQGYRNALIKNNIPLKQEYIFEGDLTRKGGGKGAKWLLGLSERPTAIIASNDLMALSVISYAQEIGLSIGKDLSVAGFDDVPPSDIFSLTTLRQPIYNIGRLLCSMLFKLINKEDLDEPQILLKPDLIIRNSTGKPLTQ